MRALDGGDLRPEASRSGFSFSEGSERYSAYSFGARRATTCRKEALCTRAIAAFSHGLLGARRTMCRAFVTGMAMNPEVFGKYADNLLATTNACAEDLYGVYAVLPTAGGAQSRLYVKANLPVPSLRVVREDDDGLVVSGMKMLATGAVFANEIWIGNLLQLAPTQLAESITCALRSIRRPHALVEEASSAMRPASSTIR